MITPLRLTPDDVPSPTGEDPARGTLHWTPLCSPGSTPTTGLVCGIAEIRPGQHFAQHSHPEPEVYFGISGTGTVLIDGAPFVLAPETALYIPGGALHGIAHVSETLRWFYTFARDGFDQIAYTFPHEGAASAPIPRQP